MNEPSNLPPTEPGRNPFVVLIGFALLGAAMALLLFGGDLLARIVSPGSNAEQVEPFATSAPSLSPLMGGSSGLSVGDKAPDFVLNDFDGQPVSLSDFNGRPVIVNFWATWCAPCRIEMPELQAAYDKYQEQGLVILALDQNEPIEVARAFFYDEMELTFTPLADEKSIVAAQFGSLFILPTTYFIDPDGIVTAIHRGPLTESQIDAYLAKTISQTP
jgi:cytochrome c biogenesis protein CcmG, thiol:disulfide interchange protein DsbE